jgi:hypothetical protein
VAVKASTPAAVGGVVVVMVMLQLVMVVPVPEITSSLAYKVQVPLGGKPLNACANVTVPFAPGHPLPECEIVIDNPQSLAGSIVE